jgi:altronate dehydratase
MKRKLTKEEESMEKLGLERNQKDLKELIENLEYNSDLINKQNYLRDHDDKWREFLRIQKDKEDNQILDTINKEIKIKEDMIKQAKEHIKEGVEIKEGIPSGVG